MSHYYDPVTQKLVHDVTEADVALERGLVPSVTTILSIIHHEHVEKWKRKNALLHLQETEDLDAAILYEDKSASGFGSICHALVAKAIYGHPLDDGMEKEITELHVQCAQPAIDWVNRNCKHIVFSEKSFVDGTLGFAGTMDVLALMNDNSLLLFDFKWKKHSKKYPMKSCAEYRYQLSAYRRAAANLLGIDWREIKTGNLLLASGNNKWFEKPFLDPWMYEFTDWYHSFEAAKLLWTEQQHLNK